MFETLPELIFIEHLNKWIDKAKELNLPVNIRYGTWLKQNDPKEFNNLYQAWKDINRLPYIS